MDEKTPSVGSTATSPGRVLLIALVVVIGLAALFQFLPVTHWLSLFQEYVRDLGVKGYALYVVGYAVCVVFFIPASLLTLGAGALYGVWLGVGIVLLGASLGAVSSFLLARTLLRSRIEKMTGGNARFLALDRAISREGAKIVFLVRLAPIFPFTYSNYAFGLTGIGTGAYALATIVGMIPGTFGYVYLGSAAAVLGGQPDLTRTVLQILGAAAALGVTIFVARLAGRAIREAGLGN